ncbi:hypothetical protein MJK86_25200, partial [Salmonella enterica subsp. enterica serovar Kentucky]|nr:hypothetical protein [Salmonella enterica subsp. enterica serovar Kentucky]
QKPRAFCISGTTFLKAPYHQSPEHIQIPLHIRGDGVVTLSPYKQPPIPIGITMLTLKTINSDKDTSIFQVTGDVSYVKESRMIFFTGWHGGDSEVLLDDGEVAYVCNEKGVTVATFQ